MREVRGDVYIWVMEDQQYIYAIEKATGLQFAVDIVFVVGTITAQVKPRKGIAVNRPMTGFDVWRTTKGGGGTVSCNFNPANVEESLKQVINFLKDE
jgi:hypothetical protein